MINPKINMDYHDYQNRQDHQDHRGYQNHQDYQDYQNYQKWMKQNILDPYGTCCHATKLMQEEFPELERVRGHYYDTIWGEREHWWLIAPKGKIIDPTAQQFPSKGMGVYVQWEGGPEPTGKCPNCGQYVYNGDQICSKKCELAFIASLM